MSDSIWKRGPLCSLKEGPALTPSEATNVGDERTFRESYRRLCDKYKERDSERLLSRLLDQYDNITSVADGIDSALNLQGETLTGIFWTSLLSVIDVCHKSCVPAMPNGRSANNHLAQSAVKSHVKHRTMVELLEEHDISDFGVGVAKFADNAQVRAPLQEIFKELIECYLCVTEYFSAHERRTSAFATSAWMKR
jgi:hypothetical protein